jgi:hypothetical protein
MPRGYYVRGTDYISDSSEIPNTLTWDSGMGIYRLAYNRYNTARPVDTPTLDTIARLKRERNELGVFYELGGIGLLDSIDSCKDV